MTNYRRFHIPGGTWFFTVNLVKRRGNNLLVERINDLRKAFRYVKDRRPFHIPAAIILPDHLHCIWTLPYRDTDFSTRWNLLKGHFSRAIEKSERITQSRRKRRERGVWQRRFWAHQIADQDDFNQHVDYIHFNPVKHGLASCPRDWPYSSFHNYVRSGIYPDTWAGAREIIDTVSKGE